MDEAEHKKSFKPLDVRDIFKDKSPKLARMIPGFIYRYLNHILRMDFTNEVLYNYGHLRGVEFSKATIRHFNVTVDVNGKENFPDQGRFIFVANHPLGGFDGGLIFRELCYKYDHVNVLVNDILMNIKNMDSVFVPINKHGAQAMENVRRINSIFESDIQVLTFPAGLVSRRRKGVIRDPDWNKNFIKKSIDYQRDIIPIHISGRCSGFFYSFSNIRKFFRIKANLEMFFLPNETYKHQKKHFSISIGKPIPFNTFDKRFNHRDWAIKVQDHLYQLPEDYNHSFSF